MFRTFLSQLLRNPVYAQADLELYEFFKSQGAAIVNDASDFAGTNGCYFIEYDCLKRRYPLYRDDLNEIVELLVETVCAKRKTTRISGADFPHEIVRSRFLKLDSSHIEFVMDCLQKNTTQVRNMKQYLLAVLFNAPTTMNNHFTSLVNHDMHAGGW